MNINNKDTDFKRHNSVALDTFNANEKSLELQEVGNPRQSGGRSHGVLKNLLKNLLAIVYGS